MPTIGELIINLNASTAAFVTELNRVKNLSFDTEKQIQRSFSIIGAAALSMLSVAVGAFAVGIQKTAEWEVHILHLAQSAGTSVETMSGLSFAAKMMGLDIDQVATAMERFDKQLLQAQLGNRKSAQNMSLLGIDPATIKSSDDALKQLADHFATLPDGAVKSGEAMMAFGKAGAAMIPILNLGRKGLEEFLAEAGRMGLVFTKEQAEQAEAFEQNVTRLKESLHGLWVEITNATLPAVNGLMAKFADTQKTKGFWSAMGDFLVNFGSENMSGYIKKGQEVVATQNKMRQSAMDLAASIAANQKAQDALQKSVESIITSYQTDIATMGMTNLQVTEYKLRVDAAKAGISGWVEGELKLVDALDRRKKWLEQLKVLDNSKIDEQKKNFLADKLAADLADLDVMKQQLEIVMQMSFAPVSDLAPKPQATEAFTESINQQTAALQHQIATFGLSAEAVARYDLAQLDSSETAKKQIAAFRQLQEQMSGLEKHAQASANAWRQFGQVAERSLDELIFSGKKFSDVLKDIVKQLGEMFLKWTLFGVGQSNASGGGGLFGALLGGLKSLFGAHGGGGGGGISPIFGAGFGIGFAKGGDVSAGVPIMVGEEGPEPFIPRTAGTILPSGSLGARVTISYHIDARGSSITEEQFRRALQASEGRAVQAALKASREVQLRTG